MEAGRDGLAPAASPSTRSPDMPISTGAVIATSLRLMWSNSVLNIRS
jgi:hypothetical protein